MTAQALADLLSGRPFLTKADVAIRLGVTIRTLERWIAAGDFPAPVYVRGPRWRPDALETFLANESRNNASAPSLRSRHFAPAQSRS
jgi:hypothetical protein